MKAIQAYYNGSVFVPLTPVNAKLNQPALVTIQEASDTEASGNRYFELFGTMSEESYSEITLALKDTERIDNDNTAFLDRSNGS